MRARKGPLPNGPSCYFGLEPLDNGYNRGTLLESPHVGVKGILGS
jgi:hypothetical protein